ncbi:hypothetical protein GTY88_07925 [Streptomyces sp. SID5926]|nr:hypothetical protein [Streptomyces sp. SID5926]
MTGRGPKVRLSSITRNPKRLVTVAEWDTTPGLHDWIQGEVARREGAARLVGYERISSTDYLCESKYLLLHRGEEADAGPEMDPDLADHVALNGPDAVLRRCAADRKILAAHPYTTDVLNPGYGPHTVGFGCETCHDWDGVTEGRGNCTTILALAEAYGLDPADDGDVEVIRA